VGRVRCGFGEDHVVGGELNKSFGILAIVALEVLCRELELKVEGVASINTDLEGDLGTRGGENSHGVVASGDLIDVEVVIEWCAAL